MEDHEMIDRVNELIDLAVESMKIRAVTLIRSAAVDVENASEYGEAKCLLVACLRHEASKWEPASDEYRNVLANLENY